MMKTKYHDEIEIDQEEILHFERGIPGFLDEKEFVILPLSNNQIYSVMQSLTTPLLAFVIVNPFHFFQEYDFELEDSVVDELGIQSEKDVRVFSILTCEDPFENTTANLQAPVVINTSNHRAKQVILHNTNYTTKHPIFQKG
jgi:flagellar assembly factor FliW